MKATYQKLKDGSWGVRVQGSASAGDTMTVTKKDGSTKVETITKVLWQGDGVTLCAVAQRHTTYTGGGAGSSRDGHRCCNGHRPHPGPCCSGKHAAGYDCGADCCDLD